MSQENAEVVRAGLEAQNTGDMDAFRVLYEPDVIMRMSGAMAQRNVLRATLPRRYTGSGWLG